MGRHVLGQSLALPGQSRHPARLNAGRLTGHLGGANPESAVRLRPPSDTAGSAVRDSYQASSGDIPTYWRRATVAHYDGALLVALVALVALVVAPADLADHGRFGH